MIDKVTVLLATYRPNTIYFEHLLQSIDSQTYENLELLIRDDSASEEQFEIVKSLVELNIRKIPYKIEKNPSNFGSNRTFELLAKESSSKYVAFCDQDDVWLPEKIELLMKTIKMNEAVLCYSDLSIINSNGEFVTSSFRNVNRRIKHMEGENLLSFFFRRNCVTGCTMLVTRSVLEKAMPFLHDYFVHDHWIALIAATEGRIAYVNKPLVKYRLHDQNQIGATLLKDITSKDDYVNVKLSKEKEKYMALYNLSLFRTHEMREVKKLLEWVNIRINLFNKISLKNIINMLPGLRVDTELTLFEIGIAILPRKIGKVVINKLSN
ncbi:glycosyltransferase [Proteiniclasticum ruminis]|uniref:glycosyltransferase n=1 Tax=Proteiniclasticum ruminis TaxID=398199 RepID=UPI0028B00922|nr:glycosyltransferase [Proteiniclasticum ruminis]